MEKVLLDPAHVEAIVESLRKHGISREVSINYEELTERLKSEPVEIKDFFTSLPKGKKFSWGTGTPKESKYWNVFYLRDIVKREDIENKNLSLFRKAIVKYVHRRDGGYSSQAILQELIDEIHIDKLSNEEILGLDENERKDFEMRIRLHDAITETPEMYLAIGKFEEGFRRSCGWYYKMQEPVLIVPGTQDLKAIVNFEERKTKHAVCRGGQHWKIDGKEYRDIKRITLPE